jgi:phosphoglycerate dehydrogenase-like enzyme
MPFFGAAWEVILSAFTLWVLARPGDPTLAPLAELPSDVSVVLTDDAAVLRAAPAADAILACVGGRELLQQAVRLAPDVPWVHVRWAGLDHVLFPELVDSALTLTNSRGVFSSSLAEFVMASVLHFAKDVPRLERQRQACVWEPYPMQEVRGRTLGIVGYGDIGRAVARLARAFGLRVLAVRRQPELSRDDELVDEVFSSERRREMLERCDVAVVAAPLTPATRGLVGAAEIQALPPHALLVNVGRGAVIDQTALVQALQSGRLRAAALDVFEVEPLPPGHPLWRLSNVLLSPHCADQVAGWLEAATRLFVDNLRRFRDGRPLLNQVDKRQGY